MSDITKCLGINCTIKSKCYRYTARAAHYGQSYADMYKEFNANTNTCEYFWDNTDPYGE